MSEKEGELYKKIKEDRFLPDDFVTTKDYNQPNDEVIYANAVVSWIDEAKAEFHLPDAIHPKTDLKKEYEQLELAILREYASKSYKWFVKWFGSH